MCTIRNLCYKIFAPTGRAAAIGRLCAGLVLLLGCAGRAPPRAVAEEAPEGLWFGGDVHLGVPARDNPLLGLPAALRAGLGVVNVEGPLVAAGAAPGWEIQGGEVRLWSGAAAARRLWEAGVRVAGVSNNHADDLGAAGRSTTDAALRAAGVAPLASAQPVRVVLKGGAPVVLTAHDLSGWAGGVPSTLVGDLAAARRQGGVLVATFHSTGPRSYLPDPLLREAVEEALRQGARVVVAHGSHMLGPVERRGASIIAWGLGNLAFACACTDESDALLLRLVVTPAGELQAAVVPVEAGLRGGPARVSADAAGVLELLRSLGSSPLHPDAGGAPLLWF